MANASVNYANRPCLDRTGQGLRISSMALWRKAVLIGVLAGVVFTLLPFSCPGQIATIPQQSYVGDMQLLSERSHVDFRPDGDFSKPSWKHAESAEFDHDASGNPHYPEVSTRVASVWTETNIYFLFWCRYDSLNVYQGEDPAVERWQLWDRDVVEVFLNPQPERVNHYYEFEVAPNNQWVDLEIDKTKEPFNDVSWNSGFEHATRIDAKNHIWTAEMRIPISSMNVRAIHPGAKWRVNFFRAAGKGGDERRKFLAWSIIPEGKTFHVPTRFGILQLVNR
jgi:Carbohydrate family 9 binding domain-like